MENTDTSKCEHGVSWSMECLSCGPSNHEAVSPATPTPAAPELTMPIDKLLELHPLPWSHHVLLIKDVNGRQVVHLGGLYDEYSRLYQGAYLSGLSALLVEMINARVRSDFGDDRSIVHGWQSAGVVPDSPRKVIVTFETAEAAAKFVDNIEIVNGSPAVAEPTEPAPTSDAGPRAPRLPDAEFYARGIARSRYHDKLFAEGKPRPTNEQFDEGWAAGRAYTVQAAATPSTEAQQCVKCGHDKFCATLGCCLATITLDDYGAAKDCECKCTFSAVVQGDDALAREVFHTKEQDKALAREIIGNVNNYADDHTGELSISAFGPLSTRITAALAQERADTWSKAVKHFAEIAENHYSEEGFHAFYKNAGYGIAEAIRAAETKGE